MHTSVRPCSEVIEVFPSRVCCTAAHLVRHLSAGKKSDVRDLPDPCKMLTLGGDVLPCARNKPHRHRWVCLTAKKRYVFVLLCERT